ncbi:MAG: PQQ-binding-like beta-propeller repeat protein, partial [Planctomycetaceae bacterium]|nr:PQQ-binding-like beta-propeller repeat protein [Planctomycetaceae bacterium]
RLAVAARRGRYPTLMSEFLTCCCLRSIHLGTLLTLILCGVSGRPVAAAPPVVKSPSVLTDWTQFLGPDGRGHARASSRIPLHWNERRNILWRTRLPGRGWSSPVVAGDRIWMTTARDRDRSLGLLSLDRESGAIRDSHEVLRVEQPGKIHSKNGHASPTPIVVGDRIYVHFGAHGTACLRLDGHVDWSTTLPYYHHHGPAGSPAIAGDLLVIACDGFTRSFYDRLLRPGVMSPQFVVALDRHTGQTRWRRSREQGRHSYSTPLVLGDGDRAQVISSGGDRVVSYDAATGRRLWWCRYTGYSVVPRPVAGPRGSGLVYVCSGYDHPRLLAIRTDGRGDVTTTHVAWQVQKATPLNPTPLLVDDALYLVNDAGITSCLDAMTGRTRWRRRLTGHFSASPLFVSGHLLAINETGTTHVLVPGPRYRRVALNRLSARTLATPAVSGNRLLIRTDRELICIGQE